MVRKKRVVWRDLADSNWGGRSRHSSPATHSYVYPKTHTSGTNILTNTKTYTKTNTEGLDTALLLLTLIPKTDTSKTNTLTNTKTYTKTNTEGIDSSPATHSYSPKQIPLGQTH